MSSSRAGFTVTFSTTVMSWVQDASTRSSRGALILKPPGERGRRRRDMERDIGGGALRLLAAEVPEHRAAGDHEAAADRADLREPRAIVRALRQVSRGADRAHAVG